MKHIKYISSFGLVSGVDMAFFTLSLFFVTKDFIQSDILLTIVLPILVWLVGGALAGFFYSWCKDRNKKIEKNIILVNFVFANIVPLFLTLKLLIIIYR